MFQFIIEGKKVKNHDNEAIQISSDFTKYYLKVNNIEYDVTCLIHYDLEINLSQNNKSTVNISFKSGEQLRNIPFIGRGIE